MVPISQIGDKWREEGSERNQSGSQVIKKLGEHENKGEVCIYFPELSLCTCEIWILSASNNRCAGVMIFFRVALVIYVISLSINSPNVNQSDLTVQEYPHRCHDSRGSIPSPVRHKLLHFYISASEFLTGPTLRAGWRELEPKVITDECESPIIRIRRMMHIRNIKTSISQSLWSRMKALEFVARRRKNKRRGDWVLNVRDGNTRVLMMKQQSVSLCLLRSDPPKKPSRLPRFNLSFFIPTMSFLLIQRDSSKNVSTWMMLPDYWEIGPSQWNSGLGLQFHFLQPVAWGVRQK